MWLLRADATGPCQWDKTAHASAVRVEPLERVGRRKIYRLQRILGHTGIKQTQVYLHLGAPEAFEETRGSRRFAS